MLLRDVEPRDYDAYVALRCDPEMTAGLGGPQPVAAIRPKLEKDVADAAAGTCWIKMIVLDETYPEDVAGTVTVWTTSHGGEPFSEIGWLVLTAYQGRGVGKRAVATMLEAARADGRWGPLHAFPGVTDAASNGICRSLGFELAGREEIEFAGRPFAANHWVYGS